MKSHLFLFLTLLSHDDLRKEHDNHQEYNLIGFIEAKIIRNNFLSCTTSFRKKKK